MAEEYIDITLSLLEQSEDYLNIKPEDIMLLSRWMDIHYDHQSEFMGYYLGLIYLENGIPKAKRFNSMEKRPFDDYFKKVKHVLVEYDGNEWCGTFFNQNMLKDLRSKNNTLIYKDKYKIESDYNGLYFSLPKSFKSLKYIKVRLENYMGGSRSKEYELVQPDDILYLEHSFDTTYDHMSENMGHFLTLIYLKDGEPVAKFFNPGDWEPIGDLIKKSKDVLVACTSGSMGGIFYNKNLLKDLRKKRNSIIFRDRYELDRKDFIGFGSNVLCIPGSFELVHFKKYRPEYAKDPLKKRS